MQGELSLMDKEPLVPWLRLATLPGVGPASIHRLLAHFNGPEALLAASPAALAAAGARQPVIEAFSAPHPDRGRATLDWARGEGVQLVVPVDSRYPPRLAELPDAPLVLYIRGNPEVLKDPQIAIVGSRNPTPGARETAVEFARHLAACGLTITSGLAIGIDGAAHTGALEGGRTLAVMGTGPDRIYPAAHRQLARLIVAQGALVTEFPPGVGPLPEHFPRRNRLIAALSLGTLVVEAALRSGSLITARLAAEQGREVFAIPGSIHNPLARGCHALIRQGAKLVEKADDILEELAPQLEGYLRPEQTLPSHQEATKPGPPRGSGLGLDPDYRLLLDAMGQDPVAPDLLIQRTGLPAKDVSSMLLMLELEGWISPCPGGRYCRVDARS